MPSPGSALEPAAGSAVAAPGGWAGIDMGGIFTDYDSRDGRLAVHKTLTPRSRRAAAVLEGFDEALSRSGISPAAVAFIGDGTAVATYAVFTGDVPLCVQITTVGFGDMLVIRRQTWTSASARRRE